MWVENAVKGVGAATLTAGFLEKSGHMMRALKPNRLIHTGVDQLVIPGVSHQSLQ